MRISYITDYDRNGGREFLRHNTLACEFHTGNTASTASPHNWADITVRVKNRKELKDLAEQLRACKQDDLGRQ